MKIGYIKVIFIFRIKKKLKGLEIYSNLNEKMEDIF